MEDLNAASLEDVKEWYKTYYGPNNAVIALAGDVTLGRALELVTTVRHASGRRVDSGAVSAYNFCTLTP